MSSQIILVCIELQQEALAKNQDLMRYGLSLVTYVRQLHQYFQKFVRGNVLY